MVDDNASGSASQALSVVDMSTEKFFHFQQLMLYDNIVFKNTYYLIILQHNKMKRLDTMTSQILDLYEWKPNGMNEVSQQINDISGGISA